MKRFLIVLGFLIFFVFLGITVWIATFDANVFRPLVVSKLESVLGNPVRLGKISLAWSGGLALDLRELGVYPKGDPSGQPVITLEKASALVRLGPLLKKDIQIGSMVLAKPRLHLVRTSQGSMGIPGLDLSKISAGRWTSSSVVMAGTVLFLIHSFEVRGGEINLSNEGHPGALPVRIQDLDLTASDISFEKPLDIKADMALFSEKQNLHLKGRIHLPGKGRSGSMEGLRLDADLSTVKLSELVPAAKTTGLRERLEGNLTVEMDSFPLNSKGWENLTARVRLSEGKVVLSEIRSPIEKLSADARIRKNHVELEQLSARLADGEIRATGFMNILKGRPQNSLKITADRLPLEIFQPHARTDQPWLNGILSVSLEGSGAGSSWPEISGTFSGVGRFALADGVLVNLNLVRAVFERLSILPGLVERLQSRLPESYREKLLGRDTVLDPIDQQWMITHGLVSFDQLRIASDTFELNGGGAVKLDGSLNIQAILRIDPDLSQAFVRSVSELELLADAKGRLEIPLKIQGNLKKPEVRPDIRYVASRLAMTKVQDLVSGYLRPKTGEGSAPGSQETSQGASSSGSLLEDLIQGAFGREESSSTQ